MLLALLPQGAGQTELDTAASLNDAIYRLGLSGAADFSSVTWISQAELFQFADDAAKQIASRHGLFLVWDDSVSVTAGTALYSLPAAHVFTVMAALQYPEGEVQMLRLSTVRDLWALDANWTTTNGDSVRASLDAGAIGTVTLYPIPIEGGTLAQLCQELPSSLQAGSSTIELPTVLQDFFTYAMLRGALGKESDHAMREMAAHYAKRMDLYDQVMSHLWGAGM